MTTQDDWESAEEILLQAARKECQPYLQEACTYFDSLRYKINIGHSAGEPRVAIEIPEPDILHLVLRFPTPFSEKWITEQAILRQFLKKYKSS